MTDLDSDRTEAVLPGVSMIVFDISPDGNQVTFLAQDVEEAWHVWVAPLDRRTAPKQLTSSVASAPRFGPEGEIYFVAREGSQKFLYKVGPNETVPRKMITAPVTDFAGISPHGEWWLFGPLSVIAGQRKEASPAPFAVSVASRGDLAASSYILDFAKSARWAVEERSRSPYPLARTSLCFRRLA